MRCLNCGQSEMGPDTTAYFAQIRECYVIIENVPCLKCPQCGEIFYSVQVSERIEKLLNDVEKKITEKVFVVDYETAA